MLSGVTVVDLYILYTQATQTDIARTHAHNFDFGQEYSGLDLDSLVLCFKYTPPTILHTSYLSFAPE